MSQMTINEGYIMPFSLLNLLKKTMNKLMIFIKTVLIYNNKKNIFQHFNQKNFIFVAFSCLFLSFSCPLRFYFVAIGLETAYIKGNLFL
jgi:hypothetical protein